MKQTTLEKILTDVADNLTTIDNVQDVNSHFLEDRCFSSIYNVVAYSKDYKKREYILKIGKPGRKCYHEFDMYNNLLAKGLPTLTPVAFSKKYDYLITIKKQLISLTQKIKEAKDKAEIERYFFNLGKVIKLFKDGENEGFSSVAYLDYVLPRLDKAFDTFSDLNNEIKKKIVAMVKVQDNISTATGFVTDLWFANICFEEKGNIVIIDAGDTHIGHIYKNLATVFLQLKYDRLFALSKRRFAMDTCWLAFLKGAEIEKINDDIFFAYLCSDLLNGILFCKVQKNKTKNYIEKIQYGYRTRMYRRYLLKILQM